MKTLWKNTAGQFMCIFSNALQDLDPVTGQGVSGLDAEGEFKCGKCFRTFDTSYGLRGHLAMHSRHQVRVLINLAGL